MSEGGFESVSSDAYSAIDQGALHDVLIVDGFDRTNGSYGEPEHDFATSYATALIEAGIMNISTVANEQIESGATDLMDFDAVFWIFGDETSTSTTFSSRDQNALKTYLESGGKLFVSGSEIGWDLYGRGTDTDKDFYTDYLKANFVADGGEGQSPATGVDGTLFSDLQIEFGITYPEDYPDQISAVGGAVEILEYAISGTYAGVAYSGPFGDNLSVGAVVYLSFPLETASQEDVTATIDAVVDYFGFLIPTAPVAFDDSVSITSDSTVTIDVLANDEDVNNDLDEASITIVSAPQNGVVHVESNMVVYEPNSTFGGTDSFTYTVLDLAGQISNSATVTVLVENVLDAGATITQIKVFPNPVKGDAMLDLTVPGRNQDWLVQILDIHGRQVWVQAYRFEEGNASLSLPTANLPRGLYLVRVSNGSKVSLLKLIKE